MRCSHIRLLITIVLLACWTWPFATVAAQEKSEEEKAKILEGFIKQAKAKADEAKAKAADETKALEDKVKVEAEKAKAEGKAKAGEVKAKTEEAKEKGKAKADELKAKGKGKGKGKAKADEAKGKGKAKADDAKGKANAAKGKGKAKVAKGKGPQYAKELKKHIKRMAMFDRLEAIANKKSNTSLLDKIAMLRQKEARRHERALARLTSDEAPTSPEKSGAKDTGKAPKKK